MKRETQLTPADPSLAVASDVKIPVAASALPDELYQAPQSWAEKA